MRNSDRSGRAAEDAVLRLVQDHAAELLRFAGRFSHCADDAHDAYQRSLEILVRRMRVEPPAQPLQWIRTVLRHEALAIRAQRERSVSRFEIDLDRQEGRAFDDPAERAVGLERLEQTAEALQRLKPHELTALGLRAQGFSYREICERTGWSYTRCNRSVYEGRRALADRIDAIESGAECQRWLPLLSALADGEATTVELVELRPHLRACAGCRATLRGFHAAPAQVAALVPPAAIAVALASPVSASGGSLLGSVELALHALTERASLTAMRLQGGLEGLTGGKLAAVAASTAALAGGGAAIEQATRADRPHPRGAAAVVAAVEASTPMASTGLVVADLLSSGRDRMSARVRGRAVRRGEFARLGPPGRSEFAPGAAGVAEFAATGRPAASAAAPPAALTAASAPAVAPAPTAGTPGAGRAPSEFGGP
jgi:RNA polymerase sigma factor (sigma-70 family)